MQTDKLLEKAYLRHKANSLEHKTYSLGHKAYSFRGFLTKAE